MVNKLSILNTENRYRQKRRYKGICSCGKKVDLNRWYCEKCSVKKQISSLKSKMKRLKNYLKLLKEKENL